MITAAASSTPDTSDFLKAFLDGALLMWPLGVAAAGLFVLAAAIGVLRRIRLARSGIRDIDAMSGKVFEQYLEVMFRRLGYRVERTRFVGDFGGDLVLSKDAVRTVVQAKRWTKKVGVGAVQEVVAAKAQYSCSEAMVVTNSEFTEPARQLAHVNRVTLWDREQLVRRLLSTDAKSRVTEGAGEPFRPTTDGDEPPTEPSALAAVETCATCARVLSAGEQTYCTRNARRFGGRMLCFRHQRMQA